MEMPTPCDNCNEIFDLIDGRRSVKWFPDTIICAPCGKLEQEEIKEEDIAEERFREEEE